MNTSTAFRTRLRHAMLLIARMDGGDPASASDAREALLQWRERHPEHEAAYEVAQAAWNATRADALRGDLPLPAAKQPLSTGRRRALSLLGLGALALGTGWLARLHLRQPVYELALTTTRGQMRTARLPDGSALELDARTQARLTFYRDRREVWLQEGAIRFEVAADQDKPFVVTTAWGGVRVLGTVFTVEARHGRMRVEVAEGRVAVWAGSPPDAPAGYALAMPADAVLSSGQAVATRDGSLEPVLAVQPRQVGTWRQGWLVFDDAPLSHAVARWNDYLATPLVLDGDPALRGLRLTGSFPLRSPGAFLDSLSAILPVRVERGEAAIRISARR